MNETTFEYAQVGDEVEDLLYGKGIVIETARSPVYPGQIRRLDVMFDGEIAGGEDERSAYNRDGRKYGRTDNTLRTLYWPGSITRHADGRVEVNPQPRPKRKVTKTVERWWVYRGGMEELMFDNARVARACASAHNGRVVHLTGSYEVEE